MRKRPEIPPEQRRDTTADKKKIKKALIVIVCAFAALGVLLGILALVTELLKSDNDDISYEDFRFFEPDYSKNILEDELYLIHNRSIYYTRYGIENIITESNAKGISPSASLFYDYFNCIINGDYQQYPQFFTQALLNSGDFSVPEKFTMQGLYDIHVTLHSVQNVDGMEGVNAEIYEVSYRIFENNGTFRRDILPDESRTLVFEVYISGGTAKINSIGNLVVG